MGDQRIVGTAGEERGYAGFVARSRSPATTQGDETAVKGYSMIDQPERIRRITAGEHGWRQHAGSAPCSGSGPGTRFWQIHPDENRDAVQLSQRDPACGAPGDHRPQSDERQKDPPLHRASHDAEPTTVARVWPLGKGRDPALRLRSRAIRVFLKERAAKRSTQTQPDIPSAGATRRKATRTPQRWIQGRKMLAGSRAELTGKTRVSRPSWTGKRTSTSCLTSSAGSAASVLPARQAATASWKTAGRIHRELRHCAISFPAARSRSDRPPDGSPQIQPQAKPGLARSKRLI